MTQATHTPGPWYWATITRDGQMDLLGRDGAEVLICEAPTQADRDLLAAAPELLEALKGVVAMQYSEPSFLAASMEQARAAIAKAEGR